MQHLFRFIGSSARYTSVSMNNATPRLVYAALCALGFCAILGGAWWETARFRRLNDKRDSMPGQLKIRLVSAALWLFIFGLNVYAVLFLWPDAVPRTPLYKAQARELAIVMGSAFALLFPALVLMIIDFIHTSRERRAQALKFQSEMAQVLHEQGERAKSEQSST